MAVGLMVSVLLINRKDGRTCAWLFPVVPHPQEIQPKEGQESFVINQETRVVYTQSISTKRTEVELLKAFLLQHGIDTSEVVSAPRPLVINNSIIVGEINEGTGTIDSLISSKGLHLSPTYPGPEGYVIDVSPDHVLVAGHDSSGTFYGMQSLMQLTFREADLLKIRAVTIIDYPDMPLRSAFYGFYLNALEEDWRLRRAYEEFKKIAVFKFNMIDLASHHYGHLEMEVPGHPQEKLWQRVARLHRAVRRYHLRPRVGGWAKWVNTESSWGADLTTLECVRTTQTLELHDADACTLKISTGQVAPNVIFDIESGESWEQEPVVVTDVSDTTTFVEGKDYVVDFGPIRGENYQRYQQTPQTHLQVLFSEVHYGEGEPAGYPLRWGKSFNPPTTLRRTSQSRIQDGQTVKVAFSYIGPDPWSLLKVRYCRSDSRLHSNGPDSYIWRWCTDPVRFLGADDFALDVDETRVFAWDRRCLNSGKSRSRIWADDIRYYYQTIRSANPEARIFVWSDMVDPAHNANLYGTEEVAPIFKEYGLTDLIMIPWKSDIARESVRFFAEHGFPIMPSCQEATEEGFSQAPKWARFVREFYVNQPLPYGLMHCNWGYRFNSEQTWEQLATVADHAWSVGPYILHKPVKTAHPGEDIYIKVEWEGDKLVFDGNQIRSGPLPAKSAFLFYRTAENNSFTEVEMTSKGRRYEGVIAGSEVNHDEIAYYITLSDGFNTSQIPKLGERMPYKIRILKRTTAL